ncbi:uncharacterized protein DUF2804 [Stackebrandtia albiflava]|uniref:Uncharacterized protein DUF2804 n=1 Tax=Stackebrandtia albiflava TaxID=406432 RepID=A0A562URD6_9ACTN|nr:DUF2804 domain-containing protein [Stackebrandtia albiflava]TWJ08164.1 uncharacterized protein DUF2804 [Stackebrandtia albiflava]
MPSAPEIRHAVDLCLPDGRLNPAAVGWTRQPRYRANLRGWGRNKRWEYWGIVTPDHIVGVVASSLDYAGLLGVYVLDRSTGTVPVDREAVVPLAAGVTMPPYSGAGIAAASGGGVDVRIDQQPDGSRLFARTADARLDVWIPSPEGHESLGVVVPWSPHRFQLTVKDLGRPVSGELVVGDRAFAIEESGSFAVLDHGRGRWPYSVVWNWAAGSEPGGGRAVQLGGKWTDGTGVTENGLFLDGRLHYIGTDLAWEYDREDWLRPWRIRGDRVDVTFHPFHERAAATSLGIVANETHQCFGRFTGRARADDGEWVDLDGLTGWAEEARNRW